MGDPMQLGAILGPIYLMLGLSILFYAGVWSKIMAKWQKDHYMIMPMMLFLGFFGLYVINTYNVWEGNVWVLVTISGWAMFIKSVVYFLLPGSAIKGLMKLGQNQSMLYLGGLAAAVIGGALSYYTYIA